MLTNEIVEKIKSELPLLTDVFSVNLDLISGVNIVNKRANITLSQPHGLKNGEKIFIRNIGIPLKIKNAELIQDYDYIVEFEFYHHLLARKTKTITLYNPLNPALCGEFNLNEDINGTKVNLTLGEDISNIESTYYIQNHDRILNGYKTIQVINDISFSVPVLDDEYTYEIDITPFYNQCIKGSTISVGQRVYGCFNEDNAMDRYCNLYGVKLEEVRDENIEIKTKTENELTCYIEVNRNVQNISKDLGDCSGKQLYTFNVYVFFPLKKQAQLNNKFLVESKILTITNNVMNRILGNKNLDININLTSNKTFGIQYLGCEEGKYTNNVLYTHKIKYGFTFATSPADFEIQYDYFRFNRFLMEIDQANIDIKY